MADLKRERYGLTDAEWAVAEILHEGCWCEPEQELYAEEGQTYSGCGPWSRGEQARRVVAAINDREPTWVDLVKAARAAGWQRKRLARGWVMWTDKTSTVDFRHRFPSEGVKAGISGPGGEVSVYSPTPAKIMTALGLVGLGGGSDER